MGTDYENAVDYFKSAQGLPPIAKQWAGVMQARVAELQSQVDALKPLNVSGDTWNGMGDAWDAMAAELRELQSQVDRVKECKKWYGFLTGVNRAKYYILADDIEAAIKGDK